MTGSAIWRMHAALRHRDRVREITFTTGFDLTGIFENFIKVTSYHFPALESLFLCFPYSHDPEIPATFLRGPDQSDLSLRRLTLLNCPTFASVSGFLLSATALTNLTLSVTVTHTNAVVFDSDPSQGWFLLACLRSMQCLHTLHLSAELDPRDLPSQHSTPKDIVSLLKLTTFIYDGPTTLLNSFISGLSAPSLQNVSLEFSVKFPFLYLSRIIDDVREEFRSVCVSFHLNYFFLVSSPHLGKKDLFDHSKKMSFRLNVNCSQYSINSINSINNTPSTKLAMAEELTLDLSSIKNIWDVSSLREFLRQFRSVRVLRVRPFVREVGLCLQQDDGEPVFPVLEEIELLISHLVCHSDKEYQRRIAEALVAFEPCERAGRLVKIYHCEQTQTQ